MTEPMTPERAERLLDRVTKGSWEATTSEATMNDRSLWRFGPPDKPNVFHAIMGRADAELVAAAPILARAYIDEARRRERLDRLATELILLANRLEAERDAALGRQ